MSFIVLIILVCVAITESSMKIEMSYSVSLLPPVTGKYFSGEVTKNELLCFGNLDYHEDTYLESFLCLVQWRYDSDLPSKSCFGLWGTRNVVVEVDGSVEFIRLKKLPRESGEADKASLEGEHWLHLSNSFETKPARETVSVNAEPIYICARSTLWDSTNTTSSFSLQFRNAFIRYADRKVALQQTFVQSLMTFGMSLPIVCPLIGTLSAARAFYVYGLNYFIVIFTACSVVILSAPVIFTRQSRRAMRATFHLLYFSTREVEDLTQRVWLLYQSVYLSSLIVCVGSIMSYMLFSIIGIEREMRNDIIRISLGVSAASFFYFFIAKLFPQFSRHYIWIPFSFYYIATVIRDKINKTSQNEVLLSIYVILVLSNMLYHKIAQVSVIAHVHNDLYHVIKSLLGFDTVAVVVPGGSSDNLDSSKISPTISFMSETTTNISYTPMEEKWEHVIVYEFQSETVASQYLERISMLSKSSLRLFYKKNSCAACGLLPQARLDSINTMLRNTTVSVLLRQCESMSTCQVCDDPCSRAVHQLVAVINEELSVSPSQITAAAAV